MDAFLATMTGPFLACVVLVPSLYWQTGSSFVRLAIYCPAYMVAVIGLFLWRGLINKQTLRAVLNKALRRG